jgi:hypothetical protein
LKALDELSRIAFGFLQRKWRKTMGDEWIIDACRIPRGIGKAGKGALSGIHPQQLGATVPRALAGRTG